MADTQNTTNIETNMFSKPALVTDLNSSYISKEQYSHARNAVRNSREGDLGTIGNEPSNELCYSAPYKIIGTVELPDDQDLIFSTDNTNSEIGIGDRKTCTYTTLRNNPDFNFHTDFPIMGVAKKLFGKNIVSTFTDKRNPVRRIDLKKLSTIKNIDEILLFKKITHPSIKVKKNILGNIPNGSYSIAIAYIIDNEIYSDFYSITNRVLLYSETNSNSLEVEVSGLDKEFEKYAVVLVGNYIDPTTKGVTKSAKIIGEYSTNQSKISLTDFINPIYREISLDKLVVQKKSWQKAGIISSNSNYLILADLVSRPEENYQLKAMQIKAEYVVTQVLADYYDFDGEDIGYYRDENYDFYIQGVTTTGELTEKWHIPGRKATASDLSIVSSEDVYEYDKQFNDCEEPGKVSRYKVYNTAGKVIPYKNNFACDRREYGHGKLGYIQSTEVYPNNPAMFGEDAGQPIRFHKMPDESIVPRYSVINGKTYINILGVRFYNIPKFNNSDIVGYKITRSDRKGGNGTVVARGIMTNVRGYDDKGINQKVLYANYTVNDLSPDQYLSSSQTVFKNGKEHNFNPLDEYYNDKFTFYSPHTLFEPRYSLGTEVKIEAEEIATINGQFERVHNHPRLKLLNQFAFWLSAAVGFIEASIVILGKGSFSTKSSTEATVPPKVITESSSTIEIKTAADLIALSPGQLTGMIVSAVASLDKGGIGPILNLIFQSLRVLTSLGLKGAYSVLQGIKTADEVFDTIYKFTGFTEYVYQYNAHALFNQSIPSQVGNKRRRLLKPAVYIPSTVVTIEDQIFNNLGREKSVFLHLNKPIAEPFTKDNSRNTISGFGLCDKNEKKTTSTGSAFYVTSKVVNPNQYGTLGSSSPVSIHSNVFYFTDEETSSTPTLYGGDCIIARMRILKKMPFFQQDLANANFPDGVEYDYRLYRNIAYPRYWLDSTKYDFSELLNKTQINFATFNRTTANKHNLDCKNGKDGKSISRIDNAYMYTSNNCVLDFFVECDYNINFREKVEQPFYSKDNTNLSQIFRSDRLEIPEEFNISRAFSDLYTTEIYAQQQRLDFDPVNPIPVEQPNSVIYSLPSFNLQNLDNWQYFLPNNYFAFTESDFGNLTTIRKLDQDRIIFLFSKSSPYLSIGRDLLQLEGSGRKITIGDGGLFAQDPREMMPTDNNYGASNSKFAFANTHMGRFYPSASQGRILSAENLEDISRNGLSFWCKNYMPINLYRYFPNYPKVENPVSGIGYLMAFDSFYETVYITKRDFSPKYPEITYENGNFLYKGNIISLHDKSYFNDISWTLSYSPLDKSFVSWHDWHPDLIIQTDDHFMTIKDNKVYKHNERYDSFCNFYGIDYPFEIEFVSSSGQTVETIRSIEYILEVYHYKNFGRDRFHMHHENFDRLIVHNTEQISPLLNLTLGPSNPLERLYYPKRNNINNISYDILFSKEENKYRINQFWDAVRDRGEFTNKEVHLFPTDESGYKRVLNPQAINIDRPAVERKKFRHYWNKFLFVKTVSGANKFLTKIANIKKLISPR